jgi:hypothetical protein
MSSIAPSFREDAKPSSHVCDFVCLYFDACSTHPTGAQGVIVIIALLRCWLSLKQTGEKRAYWLETTNSLEERHLECSRWVL